MSFLLALVPLLLSLTMVLKTAAPVPSVELWSLVPERVHIAELVVKELFLSFDLTRRRGERENLKD